MTTAVPSRFTLFASKGNWWDANSATRRGLIGVCDLTLALQPNHPLETDSTMVRFGGGNWSRNAAQNTRTASKMFLYNITIDLGVNQPPLGGFQSYDPTNPQRFRVRNYPFQIEAAGPVLIGKMTYKGATSLYNFGIVRNFTFRDNEIIYRSGLGCSVGSDKFLMERNRITFVNQPGDTGQMNGFFVAEPFVPWKTSNVYCRDNLGENLNGPGDCQPFACDSSLMGLAGPVQSATATTLTLAEFKSEREVDNTQEWQMMVVSGKGVGQLRQITQAELVDGSVFYPVRRYTLSQPWDVIPDATSIVTIGRFHVDRVFENHRAVNTKSALNMWFGGSYDCVDANGTAIDTDGLYNWGRIASGYRGPGLTNNVGNWTLPCFFNQVKRAQVSGKSPGSNSTSVGSRIEYEVFPTIDLPSPLPPFFVSIDPYQGLGEYGTEYRDNFVDRTDCSTGRNNLSPNNMAPAFCMFAFYHDYNSFADREIALGVLFEGNRVRNSQDGIGLLRVHGTAIRGTVFEGTVVNQIQENGCVNTAILPGAPPALNYTPQPRTP